MNTDLSMFDPPAHTPRRVLVMGGTGRLGKAISRALVLRGDTVTVSGRDPAKLDQLVEFLKEISPDPAIGHRSVCVDLKQPDAPAAIHDDIVQRGGIDDMVLACGPFPRTPIETLHREELQAALTVHAVAPLLLVSLLASQIEKSRGAVIALSDSGVSRPYPNHVAYLTAKGAQQTGLKALAQEFAPRMRVNIVELGIVSDPEADADPLRTHRLATRSALGRFGSPGDVVQVVLALLDATWATGEVWGIGR
jgi:pteridine reductase